MFNSQHNKSGRILIVDDDQLVIKLITRYLESGNHNVVSTNSGEKAIDLISQDNFDIIITDVKLPGMDGMAVLDKVKEVSPDTDVIVITGFGSIESAVSFMKAGALDYITKPINSDHLDIIIKKTLERKSLLIAARERDLFLKMSLTDALTGLFNQRYFYEHLEREIYHCDRSSLDLTLMMLDIDNFKAVNDNFGHQTGDQVLQQISLKLLSACRGHDTVSRYGGEEFAIILPETNIEKSVTVAERILETISSDSFGPEYCRLTISIGIANYPVHTNEIKNLIKKADIALYQSKKNGKNQYTIFGWNKSQHSAM